jgi:hypothetical protein
MFDMKNIPWDRLQVPSANFKLLEPSKEKFGVVRKHLLNAPLNLSDELRMPSTVSNLIDRIFLNPSNLIYEVSGFRGILGFMNIVPDFKAGLNPIFLDKRAWTATVVREAKELIEFIMNAFKLKRLTTATPDKQMIKLAKMFGFRKEGIRKKDFSWNNKLYDLYEFGRER